MTKKATVFTTDNTLAKDIVLMRAQKLIEKGGGKVLIRDIEEELANHCNITRDGIVAIKRKKAQPSLAIALKISEYFRCRVEDIFTLVEGEEK